MRDFFMRSLMKQTTRIFTLMLMGVMVTLSSDGNAVNKTTKSSEEVHKSIMETTYKLLKTGFEQYNRGQNTAALLKTIETETNFDFQTENRAFLLSNLAGPAPQVLMEDNALVLAFVDGSNPMFNNKVRFELIDANKGILKVNDFEVHLDRYNSVRDFRNFLDSQLKMEKKEARKSNAASKLLSWMANAIFPSAFAGASDAEKANKKFQLNDVFSKQGLWIGVAGAAIGAALGGGIGGVLLGGLGGMLLGGVLNNSYDKKTAEANPEAYDDKQYEAWKRDYQNSREYEYMNRFHGENNN